MACEAEPARDMGCNVHQPMRQYTIGKKEMGLSEILAGTQHNNRTPLSPCIEPAL